MGPSASAGTKVSAPTSSTVPISRITKVTPCVGMVPSLNGMRFLAASEPAMASTATIGQKRQPHGERQGDVVERGVGREAGKRAAVVVAGGGEGIQDLGEAMHAGIGDPGPPRI